MTGLFMQETTFLTKKELCIQLVQLLSLLQQDTCFGNKLLLSTYMPWVVVWSYK